VDISDRGRIAGQDDNGPGMSDSNGSSGEEHIDLILLDGKLILDGAGIFSNTLALTGQDSLVDAEAVAQDGKNTAVGGDLVSDSNIDDITGDELISANVGKISVSQHLGFARRVLVQRGNGGFGTALLRHSDDGIEDQDSKDLFGPSALPLPSDGAAKLTTAGSTKAVLSSPPSNIASTKEMAADASSIMTS